MNIYDTAWGEHVMTTLIKFEEYKSEPINNDLAQFADEFGELDAKIQEKIKLIKDSQNFLEMMKEQKAMMAQNLAFNNFEEVIGNKFYITKRSDQYLVMKTRNKRK